MLPTPPALVVPGGEARVGEGAPLQSPARPSTQPVPSALEVVIELSIEDELKDPTLPASTAPAAPIISTANVACATSALLDFPGLSTPCTGGSLDTSHDEEITRKLFVELNCEAIGIPGDSGLVILSSDCKEEIIEEEEVDEEEKKDEVKDKPTGSGSPSRR
ncbi:unnamed protein product [Miscanthus lutarioriparius]|uniref:Uncharacterized protein n=1 Tax=Miscanthus lutarioriparius TaxID=422564 RepID=A0A811RJX3_9POAL|nr:unnamed protein product [Miscanthus lutarioriparius]